MYHFIFILISVVADAICGIITTGTDPDLLRAIREDLRRNNDDYVESTIAGQTFASSKPTQAATSKIYAPIDNIENLKPPTKNQSPSLLRRALGRGLTPEIVDKPKHKPIKMNISQYFGNFKVTSNTPETEVERKTPPTRISKTSVVSKKNDLGMHGKRRLKLKMLTTTVLEKATPDFEELKKIKAFMNKLEKKDAKKTKEQAKSKVLSTPKYPQRMMMVNNEAPMVLPLRDQPPRAISTRSTNKELPQRLPTWRAVQSAEDLKPVNEVQFITKAKAVYETKNLARVGNAILRSKIDDMKRIEQLKIKLREGLKQTSLPPGHLLDMWPARGPRVHALRLKDRLCQRSVLLPEGPKYNSRGGTYMPRFKPRLLGSKVVIDFHQTKPPRLVLPRCCNCCRKSVLGCE